MTTLTNLQQNHHLVDNKHLRLVSMLVTIGAGIFTIYFLTHQIKLIKMELEKIKQKELVKG